MPRSVLSPVREPFRALAAAFVPEVGQCSPSQREEVERIVSDTLRRRPAGLRRQIVLFVWILDGLALIRHGRRLAHLSQARRIALLESLAGSRLLLLRRGIWGLRTLVMMGYYAQPEIQAQIGYRATPAGWGARR